MVYWRTDDHRRHHGNGCDWQCDIDLNEIVQTVYADAYYHLRIDYSAPPPPPKLRAAMLAWRTNRSLTA